MAAATPAKHNEASWRVLDSLWDAVRKHPRRMRLLFSDRYYVEEYGAGHGFPYRAWHRVKIAFRGSGESRRIVVNRQSVLPIQRACVRTGAMAAARWARLPARLVCTS